MGILKRLLIFCMAAALFAMAAVTTGSVFRTLYPMKYSDIIKESSKLYGVDEKLIYAVIKTESSFDPHARSDAGALGLMQIMPDTLEWICLKTGEKIEFEELADAEVSVRCGTFLLKYLIDEFGNIDTAIAAYHAGRGCVNGWLEDGTLSSDGMTLDKIPYRDTAHYVSKVARARNIYTNLYD